MRYSLIHCSTLRDLLEDINGHDALDSVTDRDLITTLSYLEATPLAECRSHKRLGMTLCSA